MKKLNFFEMLAESAIYSDEAAFIYAIAGNDCQMLRERLAKKEHFDDPTLVSHAEAKDE
jgi:hypothetical protein